MDYITAEQAAEAAKGLTYEKMWALLMEDRRKMEEDHRKMEEDHRKRDEQREKDWKKTEKEMAALRKQLGDLGISVGGLSEAIFSGELWKKFDKAGYAFTNQCHTRKFIENKRVIAEADYWLDNGDYVMPIEVKTKLNKDDILNHIERIEKIRGYMDARGDTRKIVGAVAGGIISENVYKFAHDNGLYVIMQTGESIALADRPDGFKAREW